MAKKVCALCGNNAGVFPKKIYEGHICAACASLIPSNIQLASADTDYLKGEIEKAKKRKGDFESTAYYGTLFIDGVHNMFCISKKQQGGVPLQFGDMYHIKELTEVGIFCTNPRVTNSRIPTVLCDVKVKVRTEDNRGGEYLVAGGVKCEFKRVKDGVEWSEPVRLTVFRSMFNQMIDNEVFGALRKLEAMKEMEAEASQLARSERWARGVLFFREGVILTDDLLKKRRNMLTKMLHPDLNPQYSTNDIMAQINEAYQTLAGTKK